MIRHRCACILTTALTGLLLGSGCQHASRTLGLDHGTSYHAAFSRQVLNPDAPEDPTPADTMPGELAHEIYKKLYKKSMTEKKKDENESVRQELGGTN
ncbi:MAG: hypothetical protein PVG49_10510 [Desulfobacteraceae bacterium]|jgi:hypothetical protein